MKKLPNGKVSFPILFFFTLVLIITVAIFLVIYLKSQHQENVGVQKTPLTKFVTSYDECNSLKSKDSYKDNYECIVTYESKYEPKLFESCQKHKGLVRCYSNPPIAEDCSIPGRICTLSYYNSQFSLPVDYAKCSDVSPSGGSFLSIRTCDLSFNVDYVYDKEIAEKLYNQCLQNGGEIIDQYGYCFYSVFQPNPSRKDYVAEKCKDFNQLMGVNKQICDWALSQD